MTMAATTISQQQFVIWQGNGSKLVLA